MDLEFSKNIKIFWKVAGFPSFFVVVVAILKSCELLNNSVGGDEPLKINCDGWTTE